MMQRSLILLYFLIASVRSGKEQKIVFAGQCMKDGRDRLLPHLKIYGTVTPEVCSKSCLTKNYKYSGVENGNECWCGNGTPPLEKIVSPNDCRAKCSGNSSQVCGGGWRINVYETGAQGTPTCESGDCPVKEWYYSGEKMFACSKPPGAMTNWLKGSNWCPSMKGVDAKLNWNWSSGWKRCKCGTPAPEMAGKSCDSGDCPVKEWFYNGKKQNACSNPDWWSKGPWCPTKKGVDAKGEYISGNYVRCKCGVPEPPVTKLPDGSECKYPPGHTMNIYRKADEACMGNTTVRGFTQAGKELIVKTHNELRQKVASGKETIGNQPPATNMRKMKWNEELAMIAQRFADQCIFGHDKNRNICKGSYVGQNGFIDYTRKKTLEELNASVDKAVKLWYDEVKKMDPSNLKPSVIRAKYGHYTQVVWADTYEVGCGIVHMKPKTWYKTIINCNYLYGGNWQGSRYSVYNPGPSCSECPKGTSCDAEYDALCS